MGVECYTIQLICASISVQQQQASLRKSDDTQNYFSQSTALCQLHYNTLVNNRFKGDQFVVDIFSHITTTHI
jgi:hypothetical protein